MVKRKRQVQRLLSMLTGVQARRHFDLIPNFTTRTGLCHAPPRYEEEILVDRAAPALFSTPFWLHHDDHEPDSEHAKAQPERALSVRSGAGHPGTLDPQANLGALRPDWQPGLSDATGAHAEEPLGDLHTDSRRQRVRELSVQVQLRVQQHARA
jgi:hypothetical protein